MKTKIVTGSVLDLVFEGEGPDLKFVEVEIEGKSVDVGEWIDRDGYHVLRLTVEKKTLAEAFDEAGRGLREFSDAVRGHAGRVWDALSPEKQRRQVSMTYGGIAWSEIPRGYQNTIVDVLIRL